MDDGYQKARRDGSAHTQTSTSSTGRSTESESEQTDKEYRTWEEARADRNRESFPYQLDRFTVLELSARGQSRNLLKLYDPVRGDFVGLKVIKATDPSIRERILRAGPLWLRLEHPNILRVLEIHPNSGERGAVPIIVTQYIEGNDLDKLIHERILTLDQKLRIVAHVCDAISYVHSCGFLHRD